MGERRGSPALLPDNDDLLSEILIRLPPLPSSLPRASLVCKRWRRLLSDPHFLRRFRGHHRIPPILGCFFGDFGNDNGNTLVFTPTLAGPDRIPPARFSVPNQPELLLGCRHGLALLLNWGTLEATVWDPVTGLRIRIASPPQMKMDDQHPNIKRHMYNGAVMRNCCSGAFKVVMVFSNEIYRLAWACVYDSEHGKWGNIISTAVPSSASFPKTSVLVGNVFCWLLHFRGGNVIRFDTDKQTLDVIQMPEVIHYSRVHLLRTVDGGLGMAVLSKSEHKLQLWAWVAISNCVARWVLQKTIELDKLISLSPSVKKCRTKIAGFDEDNNVIFLWTTIGVFMIQLESMKFTTLPKDNLPHRYYPYASFYTAGLDIDGGDGRSEMLQNA